MSARAWWLSIAGVADAIALIAAIVAWSGRREPKEWVIEPGETLVLGAGEVHPDDLYTCTGKGGVDGTPDPGSGVGGSGGMSVSTAEDGTVTAICEPGPPGNM